MDTMQFTDQW